MHGAEQTSRPRSCVLPGLQILVSAFWEFGWSQRLSLHTQALALSSAFSAPTAARLSRLCFPGAPPSPAAPQYVQAAERAEARAASARTQQDSGPGWERSRRPRAGAGRWSRVFRPRSVQLGWETARAGGGAPRESSAAAAPQCGREKQLGGRLSKVRKMRLAGCLASLCPG